MHFTQKLAVHKLNRIKFPMFYVLKVFVSDQLFSNGSAAKIGVRNKKF